MPEDKAEEGAASDPRIATPAEALQRLRDGERDAGERQARRLERAAIEVAGEVGYRRLTVQRILERAGGSRSGFYKRFADKHDCYAGGYEARVEELAGELLEAGREDGGWAAGLERALEHLARFLVVEPLYANGLLAQVHVAGGPALAKRKEVLERLSRAVDSARRETSSRHSPPPIAAGFIVSAIEEGAIGAILRGAPQEFAATVPDLLFLAISIYFGREAGEAAAGS
jgi:AcrR family transcriptional regulator